MRRLAPLLESHAEALLERWVERFRAGAGAGGGEVERALRARIPGELVALREALGRDPAAARGAPAAGGEGRRDLSGLDPDALARAYRALGDVILDAAEGQGLALAPSEVRVFAGFLADALAAVAAERERRRAGAELPFRALVDASDDYIALADPAGRVAYLNPAALRRSGFASLDEARGSPMIELVEPESRARLEGEARAVTLAGRVWEGELTAIDRATGEAVIFEARTTPIKGAGGAVELLGTINRDVSARKRAEAERQALWRAAEAARAEAEAEREKQHRLFLQVPVAVAILEGAGRVFTFANPAYRALVNGRDVVGRPLAEALPDAPGRRLAELIERVMATGEAFVGDEVPVELGGEGKARLLNFVFTPKRDAAGGVDGVILCGWDVTDLVRARQREAALAEQWRASEAQWRQLTDALPLLVSYVTADERYGLINQAYRDWFGRPPEELVGRTLREVIGEAAYAVLSPYVRRGLAGERISFEQHGVPYRLGGERDVRYTFVPQRDREGAVEGYVALLEDVTARRRLEAERERLAEQRGEVLRRQAEFEQQLIGIVSHDLRNPLNAIQLSATLLAEDGALAPPAAHLVARIRGAAARAARLVGDLLDFTRARLGGGLAIEPRPADVHAIAAGVLDEVEAAFPGRLLEVTREGDGRGEWDPDRVAQAVQNLVTNALKYSPAGSPVRVATRGEGADEVSLLVHNRGAPIPAEKVPFIFEPFQRAVGHVDHASRSVGLGLYIVRQVAEAHRGSVAVTSTEAEGTTFVLRLPRAAARPEARAT
ncbi:MAG TPA: PAS domain-containing protein [Polyangiaceae bacterium]|nr:PAS domain-containing protein [Polyangiaceae bacterium]